MSTSHRLVIAALALALCSSGISLSVPEVVNASWPEPDEIDETFSGDGVLEIPSNGGSVRFEAAPDGSLFRIASTGGNVVITRYTEAGTLDDSFAAGLGQRVINLGAQEFAMGTRMQSDGKLVISVGSEAGQTDRQYLFRLGMDGTYDDDFGTNGRFELVPPTPYDNASLGLTGDVIGVGGDGSLFVGAVFYRSFPFSWGGGSLLKVKSDGSGLVEEWGSGGVVSFETFWKFKVDGLGRVIFGSVQGGSFARLDPSGTPDPDYSVPFPVSWQLPAFEIDVNGSLMVANPSTPQCECPSTLLLRRYRSDGSLIRGWSSAGRFDSMDVISSPNGAGGMLALLDDGNFTGPNLSVLRIHTGGAPLDETPPALPAPVEGLVEDAQVLVDGKLRPVVVTTAYTTEAIHRIVRLDAPRNLGLTVEQELLTGTTRSGTSTVADPINTATGNLTGAWTDLSEAGFGMQLTRSYNGQSDVQSSLGDRWWLATGPQLIDAGEAVDAILPDGSRYRFAEDGAGGYVTPDGIAAVLTTDPGSPTGNGSLPMLRLTYGNGSIDRFDTVGSLVQQRWWDGQQTDLTYSAQGQLETVASSVGTTLAFSYDAAGRPTAVQSSTGRSVTYGYDQDGRLSAVTDAFGGVTTIDYTTEGWLRTMVDPSGVTLEDNTYDERGRVVAQIQPSGAVVTIVYGDDGVTTVTDSGTGQAVDYVHDSQGRIIEVRDPNGNVARKLYDEQGNLVASLSRSEREASATYDANYNLTSVSRPGEGTTTYTYDAANRLISETDPYGATTTYAYDADERIPSSVTDALGGVTTQVVENGLVLSVTDADGVSESYTYDAQRRRTSLVDGLGNTTTYAYDAAGRLIEQTSPEGRATTWTYGPDGRLQTTVAPDGAATSYTYDAAGRVLTVADPTGAVTTYSYNSAGLRETVTDPLGAVTSFEYDANGRLVATVAPGGARKETAYDSLGRATSNTSPLGDVRTTDFDAEGRPLTTQSSATEATATTEYDGNGRAVASVDPAGRRTETIYDDFGRVVATVDAAGQVTEFEFDLLGRQTAVIDPRGGRSETTYTPGGRIATETDAVGLVTTYGYDSAGRRTGVQLPGGRVMSTVLDGDGLVATEISPSGLTTTYEYDGAGRVTAITDPAGTVTARTYTARGELASERVGAQGLATFTYNPTGTLASATDPLGRTTTFTYDARGNLQTRTNALGGVESWTYNAANQVTSSVDALGRSTTMQYDEAGRLVGMADPSGIATAWQYGPDGRPISRTVTKGTDTGSSLYSYDPLGRLATVEENGDLVSYTYSPAGDLVARVDAEGVTSWEYDSAGRRTTMRYPDGRGIDYRYDAAGQLASITQSEQLVDSFDLVDGSAPNTAAWTRSVTTGSSVTVASGMALMQVPNTASASATLTSRVAARMDSDVALSYSWNNQFNGEGRLVLYSRFTSAGHFRVEIAAGSSLGTLIRRIGSANTVVGTFPLESTSGGNLRLRVVGDTISITSWDPAQSDEPADPTATFSSTGVTTPGTSRVQLQRLTGALTVNVDNWSQADPTSPGVIAAYTYNLDGQVTEEQLVGGTRSRGYTNGRLTSFVANVPGRSVSTTLAYDSTGRIVSDTTGTLTTAYTYDAASQMLSATPSTGSASSWTYDALGRRSTERIGSSTTKYVYDAASQLCWSTTGTLAANASCAIPPSNAARFTWDEAGRLMSEFRTSTNRVDYRRDVFGRVSGLTRVSGTTTSEQARTYHPDGLVASLSNVVTTATTTTSTSSELAWDMALGDVPQLANIAATTATGTTSTNLVFGATGWAGVHAAALNPVAVATDVHGSVLPSTGNAIARNAVYSAYGTPSGSNTLEPRLGYRGELTIDAQLDLRARSYQPTLGLMTSRDPEMGRAGFSTLANPYHYADNTPLNRIDPSGRITDKAANGYTPGSTPAVPGAGSTSTLVPAEPFGGSVCGVTNLCSFWGDLQPAAMTYSFSPSPGYGQIYFAFFIADDNAGVPALEFLQSHGDDRGFSATAPTTASRAWGILDFESGTATLAINPSCGTGGPPSDCHAPLDVSSDASLMSSYAEFLPLVADTNKVTFNSSGDRLEIQFHIKNSDKKTFAPRIDAQLDFQPLKNSSSALENKLINVEWERDPFPMMEMYRISADGGLSVITGDPSGGFAAGSLNPVGPNHTASVVSFG